MRMVPWIGMVDGYNAPETGPLKASSIILKRLISGTRYPRGHPCMTRGEIPDGAGDPDSVRHQQRQQLSVELVAVPVLVLYIGTARIEEAEIAPEIPQRIADAVFGQDAQHVAEPRQENLMRRLAPTATFAAVDADALLHHLDPRAVEGF